MVILAYFLVLVCLSAAFLVIVFLLLGMWADLKGAPFVPTSAGVVKEILSRARLKKGSMFVELGCGDGRVTRTAVREFGVRGVGVDLNPMLIWFARLMTRGLKNIRFIRENLFKVDLRQADVIFLFLLPETLVKLGPKMEKECKKGTIVISHGFKIKGCESKLIDEIQRKVFPTYYYKV